MKQLVALLATPAFSGGHDRERPAAEPQPLKSRKKSRMMLIQTTIVLLSVALFGVAEVCGMQAPEYVATVPVQETRLPPDKFLSAVKVTFDLHPNTMSFDLPWHFCPVSENGLKFAHFAAETYDPREWQGSGADASFEAGMDKDGRYARVRIEHQSAARIVERVRYRPAESQRPGTHQLRVGCHLR